MIPKKQKSKIVPWIKDAFTLYKADIYYEYVLMISSATARLEIQRSIACFSI